MSSNPGAMSSGVLDGCLAVSREAAIQVVNDCQLLTHLSRDTKSHCLTSFSLLTFPAGSLVCKSGTPSAGLFVVVRGTATAQGTTSPPLNILPVSTPFNTASVPAAFSTPGAPLPNEAPGAAPAIGRTDGVVGRNSEEQQFQPGCPSGNPGAAQENRNAVGDSTLLIRGTKDRQSQLECSLDDDLGSATAVAEGAVISSWPPSEPMSSQEASSTFLEASAPPHASGLNGTADLPMLSQPYTVRTGDWFGHPPSDSPPPLCSVDVRVNDNALTCACFLQSTDVLSFQDRLTPKLGVSSLLETSHLNSLLNTGRLLKEAALGASGLRLVPSPLEFDRLLTGKLEEIMHLSASAEEPDAFHGHSPKEMFGYPRIFGGQLLGQALMAATRTVDSSFLVHSLHCYFLRPGDTGAPVLYLVERIRDGVSFCARRVKGYQGAREIFIFTASFHKPEPGLSFHARPALGVPQPEDLLMVEEEEWRLRTTAGLPMVMRRRLARSPVRPMPVELRHCEPVEHLAISQMLREYRKDERGGVGLGSSHPGMNSGRASGEVRVDNNPHAGKDPSLVFDAQEKRNEAHAPSASPSISGNSAEGHPLFKPELNAWIKARGLSPWSNDLRLHRCIIAYFSDFVLLGTSLAPHGLFPANPRRFNMASLDHAMWFHEECRADSWLLYSLSSPWSGNARGMSLGRMFTREGVLAVSTAQEGLIRPLQPQALPAKSCL